MKAAQAVLILVFASAQTLARADCCCSAPPAPKASAHASCPGEAGHPQHDEEQAPADCGCKAPTFKSDLEQSASTAAVVGSAPLAPPALPVTLPAPPGGTSFAESRHGPPDRDVGPLHLRLHLLLI
jgi:hypothetical protein